MASTSHGQEISTLNAQIALLQARLDVIITALTEQTQDRARTQAAIDRMMRDLAANPRKHLTLVKP
jgi:hypothetical protein